MVGTASHLFGAPPPSLTFVHLMLPLSLKGQSWRFVTQPLFLYILYLKFTSTNGSGVIPEGGDPSRSAKNK